MTKNRKNKLGTKNTKPKILESDHLLRYISWGKLQKDSEDCEKVIGILPTAFTLKKAQGEKDLSSGWCEFFNLSHEDNIDKVKTAILSCVVPCPKGYKFSIGKVEDIQSTFLKYRPEKKIRIVHTPNEKNECHASVFIYNDGDILEREELSSKTWSKFV